MERLELIPVRARLALAVGGAVLAAQAGLLPAPFQWIVLAGGMLLSAYGIGASMGPILKPREPGWLEEERRRDFERQQNTLMRKFRNVSPTT